MRIKKLENTIFELTADFMVLTMLVTCQVFLIAQAELSSARTIYTVLKIDLITTNSVGKLQSQFPYRFPIEIQRPRLQV